jgi:hypothetical protein
MCLTLRYYATSQKGVSSIPEVIVLILPAAVSPWVVLNQPLTEISSRNLPGLKGWLAHTADILTAICGVIV